MANRLNQPTYLAYRDGGSWTSERGASKLAYKLLDVKDSGYGYSDKGCIIDGFKVSSAKLSLNIKVGNEKGLEKDSHLFIAYNEYGYIGYLTNEINITLSGADQIHPRKSLIVAYVDVSKSYTGSTPSNDNTEAPDSLLIVEVEGTPSENPKVPTETQIKTKIGINNPYVILAEIIIPANNSILSDSQITDRRIKATFNSDIGFEGELFATGFKDAKTNNKTKIIITGPNEPAPQAIPGIELIWIRKKL